MPLSQNLLLEIHTRIESITELPIAPFFLIKLHDYQKFTEMTDS